MKVEEMLEVLGTGIAILVLGVIQIVWITVILLMMLFNKNGFGLPGLLYHFLLRLYLLFSIYFRYATQPEIFKYFSHVAERFDLRKDIQFNTSVLSAHFHEVESFLLQSPTYF
jgi:hypothetical protein